jgi:hypothetical protein
MNEGVCIHCGGVFKRHRPDQMYCPEKACQKARKATWQRRELKRNPQYNEDQKQANKDWYAKTPEYWKAYRKKHPERTDRNRILQRVRNHLRGLRRREQKSLKSASNPDTAITVSKLIAKMDVGNVSPHQRFNEFWIVPVIAKMDVMRANILIISDRYKSPGSSGF